MLKISELINLGKKFQKLVKRTQERYLLHLVEVQKYKSRLKAMS